MSFRNLIEPKLTQTDRLLDRVAETTNALADATEGLVAAQAQLQERRDRLKLLVIGVSTAWSSVARAQETHSKAKMAATKALDVAPHRAGLDISGQLTNLVGTGRRLVKQPATSSSSAGQWIINEPNYDEDMSGDDDDNDEEDDDEDEYDEEGSEYTE